MNANRESLHLTGAEPYAKRPVANWTKGARFNVVISLDPRNEVVFNKVTDQTREIGKLTKRADAIGERTKDMIKLINNAERQKK